MTHLDPEFLGLPDCINETLRHWNIKLSRFSPIFLVEHNTLINFLDAMIKWSVKIMEIIINHQNNQYLNISVDQFCCFPACEVFPSISKNDERALLIIIIDRQLHPIAVWKPND